MSPADRADALLEELDRLAAVRCWADAALCGLIVPDDDEYAEAVRILEAARSWRERAA